MSNVMSVKEWRKTTEKKAAKLTPKARVQEPYKDRSKYGVRIGIDCGKNTGLCIHSEGNITVLETMQIHNALPLVKEWIEYHRVKNVLIRFEDARLRTWFGDRKPAIVNGLNIDYADDKKKQGAGSVKRDCSIWQDFLDDLGVDYDRVHPKDVKATTAEQFKQITGYSGRTSIHAREAAWMVI